MRDPVLRVEKAILRQDTLGASFNDLVSSFASSALIDCLSEGSHWTKKNDGTQWSPQTRWTSTHTTKAS